MLVTSSDAELIRDPDGKRLKVILVPTFKKLVKLMRECKAEGFRAQFVCDDCRTPITLTDPNPASPRFACTCTQWIGR